VPRDPVARRIVQRSQKCQSDLIISQVESRERSITGKIVLARAGTPGPDLFWALLRVISRLAPNSGSVSAVQTLKKDILWRPGILSCCL
jgi:hypothetical protein